MLAWTQWMKSLFILYFWCLCWGKLDKELAATSKLFTNDRPRRCCKDRRTLPPRFWALPSFFLDSSPVTEPKASLALPDTLSCKRKHVSGKYAQRWPEGFTFGPNGPSNWLKDSRGQKNLLNHVNRSIFSGARCVCKTVYKTIGSLNSYSHHLSRLAGIGTGA